MSNKNSISRFAFLTVCFGLAIFIIGFLTYASYKMDTTQEEQIPEGDRFLNIKEVKSKNGVTAWLVEDHTLPIIAMNFSFEGAGSSVDPYDKQGLTQLVSNTLDEGAGDLDSQAFQKALSDNSISLSFSSGRDDFSGRLKTLTRNKTLAFKLLKMAISQPRFDQEAIDRMRASNKTRILSSLSDPEWIAARILNDKAFDGHPYAKNSGGTLSTLDNITADDMRSFVRDYLGRDRLIVSVVGDINERELRAAMDDVFAPLPAKGEDNQTPSWEIQNQGEVIVYNRDIPQTLIKTLQPGISKTHPDYQTYRVMNYIFGGGGFGSRLTEEVREKRGLTYGVFSGTILLDHVQGTRVSTSTQNEKVGEVLRIIKDEMIRIGDSPVSDEELETAKSYLVGAMPLSLTSTEGISSLLLNLRRHGLPITYLDTVAEEVQAVTKEDIQRVAKYVLDPKKMMVVLVGKPQGAEPSKRVQDLPNVE